ncbi:Phosphofurin acidic cluster sorting protein 1 [Eumeta japonica]|uniref:Phosphofurin acidic cluster sorting protein 1 n=1 Tax=Eumeta variegata TaxID=151549 RepID=A0A4C1XXB1_EUMVA|nr:Phosphofurin acidic cluster sorting protein 1 [Eumeta japonica]
MPECGTRPSAGRDRAAANCNPAPARAARAPVIVTGKFFGSLIWKITRETVSRRGIIRSDCIGRSRPTRALLTTNPLRGGSYVILRTPLLLCTLRVTRLRVCGALGEAGGGAAGGGGAGAVTLAARMHSSKRTLRSNDIQIPPLDVELDLCFSLQYPHFVKRDGNSRSNRTDRRELTSLVARPYSC